MSGIGDKTVAINKANILISEVKASVPETTKPAPAAPVPPIKK